MPHAARGAKRSLPMPTGAKRPEQRTGFAHPERLPWVHAHRAILVSACLSLIRAWLEAQCPEGDATLGSYESWARIMGGVFWVFRDSSLSASDYTRKPIARWLTGVPSVNPGGRPTPVFRSPRRMCSRSHKRAGSC
jgi:hypothetical protein